MECIGISTPTVPVLGGNKDPESVSRHKKKSTYIILDDFADIDRDYNTDYQQYLALKSVVPPQQLSVATEDMDIDCSDEFDRDFNTAATDLAATRAKFSGVARNATEFRVRKRSNPCADACTDDTDDSNDRDYVGATCGLRSVRHDLSIFGSDDYIDRSYSVAEQELAAFRQHLQYASSIVDDVDSSNDRDYGHAAQEIHIYRTTNPEQHGLVLGDGSKCALQTTKGSFGSAPKSGSIADHISMFQNSAESNLQALTDACNDRTYSMNSNPSLMRA